MRKSLVLILIFVTVDLSAQHFPVIISNGFESDIVGFIKSKTRLSNYDFFLIKSEDSYWYKSINYRLVCFKNDKTDLIEIHKNKKNNKFRIDSKIQVDFNKSINLLDSLKTTGLFNFKEDDLNTNIVDSLGNTKRLVISDGTSELFELCNLIDSWGLYTYEPKEFYDFSGNKNLLIVLHAINLFNDFWKIKN
jgi:hypothetical protein